MKQERDCPFCEGIAEHKSSVTEKEFRKEKFKIREFYYKCKNCNEEFTSTRTDELTINQVYNQYREKHEVPFPEELILLRFKYGLSAQKMSQLLGLGINTYSNYEKGEMPSLANAKLINSAKNHDVFVSYLKQAKELFNDKAFTRIEKKIREIVENDLDDIFLFNINKFQNPNRFNGYSVPNKEKLSNLLVYYIAKNNIDYNDKLKLNKMLFYTDFISYKNTGKSITGLSYRAIPYGPVPMNYDFIFAYFTEIDKLIEAEFVKSQKSKVIEVFRSLQEYDLSVFNEEEKIIIEKIVNNFKDVPSWDMVELSHKERSWIEMNESREIINYQEYAFDTNVDFF